jgi:hypothetical protein
VCFLLSFTAVVNSEDTGKSTCGVSMWPVVTVALVLGKGGGKSCIYCVCNALMCCMVRTVVWCVLFSLLFGVRYKINFIIFLLTL